MANQPYIREYIKIEQHYSKEWTAHEIENYDYDSPIGYGNTEQEAIDDLS